MRDKTWFRALFFAAVFLSGDPLLGQEVSEPNEPVPEAPALEGRGEGLLFLPTRWDHNFALTFGISRGTWEIERFDPVRGKRFPSQAILSKLQYSFHLPITGHFGYSLGSSFGYYWEERTFNDTLHRVSSVHLPGIHVGFVTNLTPGLRVEGAFETYLERLEALAIDSDEGRKKISITMRPDYDFILALDVFHSLNWGVRVEWHTRRVSHTPPKESEGQVVNALIRKKDAWIALGFIFHFFAG